MNIYEPNEMKKNIYGNCSIYTIRRRFEKPSSFKNSTLDFIQHCKHSTETKYDIKQISEQFGFKQRRFYEVINVFEAIGCTPKIDDETFIWIGFEQIRFTIERMANEHNVFVAGSSLDDIFNNQGCISVQRVTEEFLLLFVSLEQRKLNLIQAAAFLSRHNEHEKTTRCKLYQVAAILEIAKIIKKTDRPSEFEIHPDYFISTSEKIMKRSSDPLSLLSLLNRPEPFCTDNVCPTIRARNREYFAIIY